jgi:hypothetical protein
MLLEMQKQLQKSEGEVELIGYQKTKTFLWAYETIFNWLGITFDRGHKEQF